MQIVIEIPEEEYQGIVNDAEVLPQSLTHYERIIKNGKPLPKGHGRLIDTNDIGLNFELSTYTRLTGIDEMPYEMATKALDEAQTVIPADGG